MLYALARAQRAGVVRRDTLERVEEERQSKHMVPTGNMLEIEKPLSIDVDPAEGRFLIVAGQESVDVVNAAAHSKDKDQVLTVEASALRSRDSGPYQASWLADTGAFVTSSVLGEVQCWDTNLMRVATQVQTKRPVVAHAVSRHGDRANNVLFSLKGSTKITLWDLRSGATQRVRTQDQPTTLTWSPANPLHFVFGDESGRVMLFDLRYLTKPLHQFDFGGASFRGAQQGRKGHLASVQAISFSPDGERMLSADNMNVCCWDARTFQHLPVEFERGLSTTYLSCRCDMAVFGWEHLEVVALRGSSIDLLSTRTGMLVQRLYSPFTYYSGTAYNPILNELYALKNRQLVVFRHSHTFREPPPAANPVGEDGQAVGAADAVNIDDDDESDWDDEGNE
eukprot:m.12449 g.12449  ORF g.12449 m.12449 type:complete len:395 (-) comp5826_c0_seq2:3397-4581(-)